MTTTIDYLKTRDHLTLRFGVWPAQSEKGKETKGSIVLLGGRAEFIEKYRETTDELNLRHFNVYCMDWRGQGLSSRLLPDRLKGFVKTYDDYIDDLDEFVDRIVVPEAPKPVVILAHSMGAHIALRFAHDHPGKVEKLVLISPMIDIRTAPFPNRLARFYAHLMVKLGFASYYVWGAGKYNPVNEKFRGNPYTSDLRRFRNTRTAILKQSDIGLGGVTYGWVSAAFESIDILASATYAPQIQIPVLMMGAGNDRIVSIKAQKRICDMMEQSRYVVISSSRHEILQENDSIRKIFWEEFDQFVR